MICFQGGLPINLANSHFVGSVNDITLCENGKPIRLFVGGIEQVRSHTLYNRFEGLVSQGFEFREWHGLPSLWVSE